jgi:hypothetical protein
MFITVVAAVEATCMLGGTERVGAVVSDIITRCTALDSVPFPSTTVQVTSVVPRGKPVAGAS